MAELKVCLLGRFEITLDGESILPALGNSKKKTALLQYLLVNRDSKFTNADLFEYLWGDDDSINPSSGLNTLVSRLRKDLKPYELGDIITTVNNVYRWNDELYQDIDVYRFEELAEQLKDADALDEENKSLFEEVFALYQGDLLSGVESGAWLVPKSLQYHNLYLATAHKYIELLADAGQHEEILRIARRALEIDQFDTKLNLELMNAMIALDMKMEAMNHYNYTVSAHNPLPGFDPSEGMLDFYKKQLQAEYNSQAVLEAVSRDLKHDDGDKTALVCDYTIFRDIYNINMRNLQRLGITMFLGVLTLTRTTESTTDSEAMLLDRIMGMLQATLKFNLRKGDTISRYGPSQFLVLLPTQSLSNGALALERVKNAFYKNCTIPDFVLSYKLTAL